MAGYMLRNTITENGHVARGVCVMDESGQFLTGIEPLFTQHLGAAGLGHISEIMSAEAPFEPDGCIAQAWSESEVLRALLLVRKLTPMTYGSWESQLKWEPY